MQVGMYFLKVSSLLILAVMALVPQPGFSGGVLHVFPPEVDGRPVPVARPTVLFSRTLITVSESTIAYRIEQTFYNDNEFPVSGLFLLPLAKSAVEDSLVVRINGIAARPTLYTPSGFFSVLRKLTEVMHDPSLLGLAGQNILVLQEVRLGIREQKTFRIEYTVPFAAKDGLTDILYPLTGERYARAPVAELEITVRFKLARPIKSLFSPLHQLSVMREAPHRALVSVRKSGKRVKADFRLLALIGGPEVDLRLLTHRLPGEEGYFMALVGPPSYPARSEEPNKDVVFVVDSSGSLGRSWYQVAKRAVSFCLGKLGPQDRFNVLAVGTRVSRMRDRLVPVTDKNVLHGIEFLSTVESSGGTDLYNGLMEALAQFTTRKRHRIIVLISDGRGTVGITDPVRLIDDVKRYNRWGARIFVLGVGDRTDVALLDKLAVTTKGTLQPCPQASDFQSTLSRFFSAFSPPQVSQLALDFGEISTQFVYPNPLPDLFRQESLVILGRYSGDKDVTRPVTLRWKMDGRPQSLSRTVRFARVKPEHPYLAPLWGMRHFGQLLERDLAKGSDSLVRSQIRTVAERFGFKTPAAFSRESKQGAHRSSDSNLGAMLWHCKTAHTTANLLGDEYRYVQGLVFRRDHGRWVDTRFRRSLSTKHVKFLSDDYFRLLQDNPGIGEYLALSPEVTLVLGNEAIVVSTEP